MELADFSVRHSFRVARVDKPILGADFFRKHSINIDCKINCLHLAGGSVVGAATPAQFTPQVAASQDVQGQRQFRELLQRFPQIAVPKFDPEHIPAHGVRHVVPTTGPPVFARARPLFAEKLKVAKDEFDKMLALQIILSLIHI